MRFSLRAKCSSSSVPHVQPHFCLLFWFVLSRKCTRTFCMWWICLWSAQWFRSGSSWSSTWQTTITITLLIHYGFSSSSQITLWWDLGKSSTFSLSFMTCGLHSQRGRWNAHARTKKKKENAPLAPNNSKKFKIQKCKLFFRKWGWLKTIVCFREKLKLVIWILMTVYQVQQMWRNL